MKNTLIAFTLSLITSLTALAAVNGFTDQDQFPQWLNDSATKMQHHGIIKGYEDGSFNPSNKVTRAEIAVMLDRFAENVVGKKLQTESAVCTLDFRAGLLVYLQDQNGNPITGAEITSKQVNVDAQENEKGIYSLFHEMEGQYTFQISKEGYSSHIDTVLLQKDECHVMTIAKTITLFPTTEEASQ